MSMCTQPHAVPANWKEVFVSFCESVRVLSCVRLVALIFQHDLFIFQSLGAALAEQNQIMLLN